MKLKKMSIKNDLEFGKTKVISDLDKNHISKRVGMKAELEQVEEKKKDGNDEYKLFEEC